MVNKLIGIQRSSPHDTEDVNWGVIPPTVSTGELANSQTSTQKGAVYTSIQYTQTERTSSTQSCPSCTDSNQIILRNNIIYDDLDRITTPLCIRVPVSYKAKYMRLTHKQKQLFKLAVIGVLDSIVNGGKRVENNVIGTMVYNVNINVSKAESNPTVNVNMELDTIKDILKEMDEMLKNFYKMAYTDNEKLRYMMIRKKLSHLKQLIKVN